MARHRAAAVPWQQAQTRPIAGIPRPRQLAPCSSAGEPAPQDLGQGNISARVLSNNRIQLKIKTKDFVGEFFHYTNDLFLIYGSGHLARLTCNRS